MRRCQCNSVPTALYLDQAPAGWSEGLADVAAGNWKTLQRCTVCEALFAVDAYDKFHERVVVRIAEPSTWEAQSDSIAVRESLLLQSRGGLAGGDCICRGCAKPRVQGVVYCLEHLWETGARR